MAADASTLCFGRRASHVARAASADQIAFGLYLPGAEMMLAASCHSVREGQRQMLFQHRDRLSDEDVLLMGRPFSTNAGASRKPSNAPTTTSKLWSRKRPSAKRCCRRYDAATGPLHSILKPLLPALLLGADIATRLHNALQLIAGRTYSHRPGIIKSKLRVARPKPHEFMSQKPC